MAALNRRDDLPFVAAPSPPESSATVFTCALCGLRFTHSGMACGDCPLGRGCDTVGCPRCGHAFPRASRMIDSLRGLARFFRRSHKDTP